MRILVTGVGSPPGLSLLRSLQISRFTSLKLFACDAMDFSAGLYEPYLQGTQILPSAKDEAAYLSALQSFCLDNAITCIVPCSEAEISVLSHYRDKWRADLGIHIVVSSPDSVEVGVNKQRLAEVLDAAPSLSGIPTIPCTSLDELEAIQINFPCVIKPCDASGARGVSYPATRQALLSGVEQLLKQHGRCLIQKYIAGPVSSIYTLGALYNNGKLIQTSLHHKLRTTPAIGGSAVAGETVVDTRLSNFGVAALEHIGGWHGFVAIEFKVEDDSDTPYILEINPRLWGFSYLMTQAGVNFGEMMVQSLLLNEQVVQQTYRSCRMVRAWQDIEVPYD